MFREMRRSLQQLSDKEAIAVLVRGTSGVLALSGDDGYPYAVPMSYVFHDGKIFFHCAKSGHKLDAIARCSKASFCVVDQDLVLPEKYTTAYRSVIAFGRIRILSEADEILDALNRLAIRYAPDDHEGRENAITSGISNLYMLEMTIDHLTGKQGKSLLQS